MFNHKISIIYYLNEENHDSFLNYIYFINHGLAHHNFYVPFHLKNVKKYDSIHVNLLVVFNNSNFYNLNTMTYDYIIIDKNDKKYAWKEGMKYLKKKYDSNIENEFTHFLLLDSSVIGPIFDNKFKFEWVNQFLKYDKISINDSYLFECFLK
jgi:hypothetical protein